MVQLWNSTGAPELQEGPLLEPPELELPLELELAPELDPELEPLAVEELPVVPELPPELPPVDVAPELPPLLLDPGTQTPSCGSWGSGCVQTCPNPQPAGPVGLHSVSQLPARQPIPAAQSWVGWLRRPGCTQAPNVSPP